MLLTIKSISAKIHYKLRLVKIWTEAALLQVVLFG